MNILVTLDRGYLKPLCVMLRSLCAVHPHTDIKVFVMNKSLTQTDFDYIKTRLNCSRCTMCDVKIDDTMLKNAPVTDRYPPEMYYRIFAADFLPGDVDRVLYLDPDLVVLKNLESLYSTPLEDNLFAAASHVNKPMRTINGIRLQMAENGPYINSGVMVMNIKLLRKQHNRKKILQYIEKNKKLLFLPDQDVISAIYCDRIVSIDPYIYNMTERMLLSPKSIKNAVDFEWVKNNSAIVHYCGRNKPWKKNYHGSLDCFYTKYSDGLDM